MIYVTYSRGCRQKFDKFSVLCCLLYATVISHVFFGSRCEYNREPKCEEYNLQGQSE